MMRQISILTLLLASVLAAEAAERVYLEPEQFLRQTFRGEPPPPRTLWPDKGLRQQITTLLGHPPSRLRFRYWRAGDRTAWILEEIGKERPITTGVVVRAGRIERLQVLIYRESRGWEVSRPGFTDQFRGASLQGLRLDRRIDGISGATLSVRALGRLARLALLLTREVEMK